MAPSPKLQRLPARTRPLGLVAALLALAGSLVTTTSLSADEVQVPEGLQAELLARLLPYDRNFQARAGSSVDVVILVKAGNARSKISAAQLARRLSAFDHIGPLPLKAEILQYESASALAKACGARRTSLVYVAPGFDHEVTEIGSALSSVNVLSAAGVPTYVPSGVVVGFELTSGRPRMLINLAQARRQKVEFRAAVLNLMKVVVR
jgi:hypothetical protein